MVTHIGDTEQENTGKCSVSQEEAQWGFKKRAIGQENKQKYQSYRERSELNTLRNSRTLGALSPWKGLLGEAERTTLLLGVFTLSLDELSEHREEEMLSLSGDLGSRLFSPRSFGSVLPFNKSS